MRRRIEPKRYYEIRVMYNEIKRECKEGGRVRRKVREERTNLMRRSREKKW